MCDPLAGAVVGHLLAESLLQPEWMLAQKRVPSLGALTASLGHSVVWGVCVYGLSGGAPYGPFLALCAVHHAIDCTPVMGLWFRVLGLQSMASSMSMAVDEDMPHLVASVQFSLAATSEAFASHAFHVLILWVFFEVAA